VRFVEQPIRIRFVDEDGHVRLYRPDCLVVGSRWVFEEVKLEAEASTEANEARWNLIGNAMLSLGFCFRVVTERHIRREPRWTNINLVWRNRLAPIPPTGTRTGIASMLRERGQISIDEIIERFPELQYKHVLMLVRRGFLAVDLDAAPLSGSTAAHLGPGLMTWVHQTEEDD
jgi:hypothetical protein